MQDLNTETEQSLQFRMMKDLSGLWHQQCYLCVGMCACYTLLPRLKTKPCLFWGHGHRRSLIQIHTPWYILTKENKPPMLISAACMRKLYHHQWKMHANVHSTISTCGIVRMFFSGGTADIGFIILVAPPLVCVVIEEMHIWTSTEVLT